MSTMPWMGMLIALQQCTAARRGRGVSPAAMLARSRIGLLQSDGAGRHAYTVTIVETLSRTTLSLSWRDATACSYSEQIWLKGTARCMGRCALSGSVIRKGDVIYRPRVRVDSIPKNKDAMILESAVIETGVPLFD